MSRGFLNLYGPDEDEPMVVDEQEPSTPRPESHVVRQYNESETFRRTHRNPGYELYSQEQALPSALWRPSWAGPAYNTRSLTSLLEYGDTTGPTSHAPFYPYRASSSARHSRLTSPRTFIRPAAVAGPAGQAGPSGEAGPSGFVRPRRRPRRSVRDVGLRPLPPSEHSSTSTRAISPGSPTDQLPSMIQLSRKIAPPYYHRHRYETRQQLRAYKSMCFPEKPTLVRVTKRAFILRRFLRDVRIFHGTFDEDDENMDFSEESSDDELMEF